MSRTERKCESIRLPRGTVVFYTLTKGVLDNDGTLYDDLNLELVDAFENGQRVSCDGYDLLSEVASELRWNSL